MKITALKPEIKRSLLLLTGLILSMSLTANRTGYIAGVDLVDIKVEKVADNMSPLVGSHLIYTLRATNIVDDEDATNVVIEEILPQGNEYVTHNATAGSWDPQTGLWTIPSLLREQSAELTIEVIVNTVDEFCNVIRYDHCDQMDKNSSNNRVELCITPELPDVDIAVSKVASTYSPAPGQVVVFTMEVKNLSTTTDATQVLVKELLPAGLTYVDHTATLGVYNPVSGEWTIAELEANQTAQLTLEATVDGEDEVCNTIEFISADQDDTNLKNNKSTICLYPETPELDLAVTKEVYNAVPKVGEHSEFTVTITNLHPTLAATNVEVTDVLDTNLELFSFSESMGNYDDASGIWSIPALNPGQTAILVVNVIVHGSADNIATLTDLDQVDNNPNNDEAMASVTVSSSSGGNDGGLESDGSLAELIAQRNFSKEKTDAKKVYSNPVKLVSFDEELAKTGDIRSESKLKSLTDLIQFVPENGPFGTQAFVTTPGDLLGVSNAQEVFSADYFDTADKRMAAILGLTTTDGEVYNHTKVICDRLTGASLELVKTVQVDEHPFILSKLVQANGEMDYAVTFVAYQEGSSWMIDNKWHHEEYAIPAGTEVFNFQIWSATPQSTVELMEAVIDRMKEKRQVTYRNTTQPDVPAVIVENGIYQSGNLVLKIQNPGNVEQVKVKGTLTRYENASREAFEYTVEVRTDDNGQHLVDLPVGYVFDVDFSIGPDGDKKDGLYFADGPWSKDFDREGARIDEMVREEHDGSSFSNAYLLERSVKMRGEVKTYASLFRLLRPGSVPVDLSDYNQLVFEASGTGDVELVIAKASIDNWTDQYRVRFSLSANMKTYRIDYNQLKSLASNQPSSAEDVQSVTLTFSGDGVNYESFDISLKNARFGSADAVQATLTDISGIRMNVYPNPMNVQGYIEFELPETSQTRIMIYDITGQEVLEVLNQEMVSGNHRIPVTLDQLPNGMYLVKMNYKNETNTKRINLIR